MSSYRYKGIELTPNIFAELLINLFDGKQFKRSDAIDEIVKYHKEKGGILEKNEYFSVFKKACQKLNDNGLENIRYGTWRLNYKIKEIEIVDAKKKVDCNYIIDKTVGEGKNSVYLYYYETYKKYAEICGKNIWECKIGRTEKAPIDRIIGQAGTCYPEIPHIALVIKCDDSNVMENAIHSVLRIRNRWIKDSPGTEWFMTSPEEIELIYKNIILD